MPFNFNHSLLGVWPLSSSQKQETSYYFTQELDSLTSKKHSSNETVETRTRNGRDGHYGSSWGPVKGFRTIHLLRTEHADKNGLNVNHCWLNDVMLQSTYLYCLLTSSSRHNRPPSFIRSRCELALYTSRDTGWGWWWDCNCIRFQIIANPILHLLRILFGLKWPLEPSSAHCMWYYPLQICNLRSPTLWHDRLLKFLLQSHWAYLPKYWPYRMITEWHS